MKIKVFLVGILFFFLLCIHACALDFGIEKKDGSGLDGDVFPEAEAGDPDTPGEPVPEMEIIVDTEDDDSYLDLQSEREIEEVEEEVEEVQDIEIEDSIEDEEEPECFGDEDCLDDNICNGLETCDPVFNECVAGTLEDDGTLCGDSPRQICIDGVCSVSRCGDGFVDAGGDEECELGDTTPCTTSCGSDADQPCNSSCLWDACPPPVEVVRINCGDGEYTDGAGNIWMADNYFTGGLTWFTMSPIAGTSDDPLFQTERVGNPPLSYGIPLTAADTYTVNLYFAEIVWRDSGLRVFDVTAEGVLVIDDLDIFDVAGPLTAYDRSFTVDVSDGELDLVFINDIEYAKISAIEVCR